jgi:hypothetical protein
MFDAQGVLVQDSAAVTLRSLFIHSGARDFDAIHLDGVTGACLEDCVIHGSGIGASGRNIAVDRCEVFDTANSGIRIFGSATPGQQHALYAVRNSHFHQIGQGLASDFGAVYLAPLDLECWRENRTCHMPALVSGNVIHGTQHLEYGANGIYLDAAASGVTVSNNLVYNTGSAAIYAHCGRANTVRSNLFAHTNRQDLRAPFQGCDESGVGEFVVGQTTATQNVMVVLPVQPPYAAIAGGTATTAAWRRLYNTTTFDWNLYTALEPASLVFPPGVNFTQWQKHKDRHSLAVDIAHAGFVNASAHDFRLQADSVAKIKLGVIEPDYVNVGPRRTDALLRLHPPMSVFDRYPFVK